MVDFSPRATHTNKNLKVCQFIPHVYLFSFAASLSQWPLVDRIIDKFHYMPKFEDAEQILEDKKTHKDFCSGINPLASRFK
jgi:hypothetical protein